MREFLKENDEYAQKQWYSNKINDEKLKRIQ